MGSKFTVLRQVRFMNATTSRIPIKGPCFLTSEFTPFEGGGKYKLKLVFELKRRRKTGLVFADL